MPTGPLPYSATFRLPGCVVRVDSEVDGALSEVARVYRNFSDGARAGGQPTFSIHDHGRQVRFVRHHGHASDPGFIFDHGCLPHHAEWEINRHVVAALDDHLLFHAAAVRRAAPGTSLGVMFPAGSGSGKTTLAAGLVRRGWDYLTDELVIVDPDTIRIVPFPKAFSVKPGSYELFDSLTPDPTGPAGDRVWYLDPERLRAGSVAKAPTPIGCVVLPKFQRGASTRVELLTIGETVVGLFENAVNIARHKEAGLDRLIEIAQTAPGFRLVFGDLENACATVEGLIGGNGRSCS